MRYMCFLPGADEGVLEKIYGCVKIRATVCALACLQGMPLLLPTKGLAFDFPAVFLPSLSSRLLSNADNRTPTKKLYEAGIAVESLSSGPAQHICPSVPNYHQKCGNSFT